MPIYDAHECAVNTSLAVIPSARSWRRRRRCLVLVAVMAGAAAQAADAPAPAAGAADKLSAARAQVAAKRWPEALTELRQLGDGTSADWNNLMGYVLRKSSPPDLDGAERHYGEALRIDPRQRGALVRISANVTSDFGNVTNFGVGAGLRGEDCRFGGGLPGS